MNASGRQAAKIASLAALGKMRASSFDSASPTSDGRDAALDADACSTRNRGLECGTGHTGAVVGFYGFGASHVYLSYLLYTLVAFHIGGALKHE